jgi:hypothetical protein
MMRLSEADGPRGIEQGVARWGLRDVVLLVVVTAAIVAPRIVELDRFVTPDEPKWLTRSANFCCAFAAGDYAATFQRGHPGVTTMWAGAAGISWLLPGYCQEYEAETDREEHASLFQQEATEPVSLLAAGRFWVVLAGTLTLSLAFVFARRLLGRVPAFLGFMLIAFDPFHTALSRLLHLDGLLASFMLLSTLSFLSYLEGRRFLHLVVSGVAAGLAWLTKSPGLFLVPLVTLLALLPRQMTAQLPRGARPIRLAWQRAWPLLAWALVAIIVTVALWPAMWVDPLGALSGVLQEAIGYAQAGHGNAAFFDGTVVPDGRLGASFWYYYPLTYLWRTTPVVILGLLAAIASLLLRWPRLHRGTQRSTAAVLGLLAMGLAVLFTLGTKKGDRYLCPAFLPLDLLAGMGWVATVRWPARSKAVARPRWFSPLAVGLVIAFQVGPILQTSPYYLTYYNPVMGGTATAPESMQIGWGEGLDQAARYLSAKPDADQLGVFSWYNRGCFSYFFSGNSERILRDVGWGDASLQQLLNSDYAVVYIHQWQRETPLQLLAYLSHREPERSVWINGLEYARIYSLVAPLDGEESQSSAGVLLGQSVLLDRYALSGRDFQPGQVVVVTLFWQADTTPSERLKVFVHLLDESRALVTQSDSEPVGWLRPTVTWGPGEPISDRHALYLPPDLPRGEYVINAGLYRLDGTRLVVEGEGEVLGDAFVLDTITVH